MRVISLGVLDLLERTRTIARILAPFVAVALAATCLVIGFRSDRGPIVRPLPRAPVSAPSP